MLSDPDFPVPVFLCSDFLDCDRASGHTKPRRQGPSGNRLFGRIHRSAELNRPRSHKPSHHIQIHMSFLQNSPIKRFFSETGVFSDGWYGYGAIPLV